MEMSTRNRYRIDKMQFTSITDAKRYILLHKKDYIAHDGIHYKIVPIYCGFNRKGYYQYISELKKVVRVSD